MKPERPRFAREVARAERGELAIFSTVGEGAVPAGQRAAARAALQLGCDLLDLERPRLVWFAPESFAERLYVSAWGTRDWSHLPADPSMDAALVAPLGELWVRRFMSAAATARAVARELRHSAPDGLSREVRAPQAEAFAELVALAASVG